MIHAAQGALVALIGLRGAAIFTLALTLLAAAAGLFLLLDGLRKVYHYAWLVTKLSIGLVLAIYLVRTAWPYAESGFQLYLAETVQVAVGGL